MLVFLFSFLITGSFCEILYKKSTSFPNHKECTLSGLKLVSLPTLSNYRLQFYINAAEFPASIDRAIFKHSFLNFFDKKDRQVASLQVTTLRDQFVQIVLVDKQGREVTSAWEAITGTSEQLQIALEASNVYFNGRRLLFQMSSKESIKVSQWPVQTPADQSGKPAEWKEIEEFLSSELQQPINLHWEVPSEAKDVSDLSKEQVFVNQVSTLDFPFEGVDYVAFDEQIVEQLTFNPKKSFKQHFNEAILAKIPRIKAEKEHLLMAALVSGFVSYLAILTLLSRMTASTKSSSKRQRSSQEPKQLTDSNVSISPLLHDSRGSLHINNPSSPLSTSQTKSTDILRPILLTKFHRSSQLALLNSSSMHLEIQQHQSNPLSKQGSQSGDVHELSLPSLSFNLADNRHILFPSKLRNFQK